jgi:hypothetical protein
VQGYAAACLECDVPSDALALAPVILAVVLVASAVGKVRSPSASAEAFRDLRVPSPLSRPLAVKALPWGELILAMALVLAGGALGVVAALAALLLFTAYLVLVVRALGFDEDVECACFGAFAPGRISSVTVVRNVWLVVLAALAVGISTQGSSVLARVADERLPWWWLLGAVAVAVTVMLILGVNDSGAAATNRDAVDLAVEEGDYLRTRTPAVAVTLGDGTVTDLRRLSASRAQLLLYVSEGCGSCVDIIAAVPGWRTEMPQVDVRLIVAVEPEVSALADPEEPKSAHDPRRLVWDSFGLGGTPAAFLLGADGLVAGGPVLGGPAVRDFVSEIRNELQSEAQELSPR